MRFTRIRGCTAILTQVSAKVFGQTEGKDNVPFRDLLPNPQIAKLCPDKRGTSATSHPTHSIHMEMPSEKLTLPRFLTQRNGRDNGNLSEMKSRGDW